MAKDPRNILTGKVRFSYTNVWVPKASEEGKDPKYSVSLIIPKSDTKTIEAIKAGIEAAIVEGIPTKFGGKRPTNLKYPLRDGDVERPDKPEYKNAMFINVADKKAPGIVDKDRNEILNPEEFYAGCYGRATFRLYPFNADNKNKGVAAGLNNLQKLEDGDRFDGRTSAQDDFAEDFVDDPLMG